MKKYFLLFILLSSIVANAQRITPEQIPPLFRKTAAEIKSFLLSNNFVYRSREGIFYTYVLEAWGNSCVVTIALNAGRLDVLSIHESVMYFNIDLAALYEQKFIFSKSCTGDIESPPRMYPGCLNRFDNKALKLMCTIVSDRENGFYMNYAHATPFSK